MKKVQCYCIWRDSEPKIYQTLKQLEELEKLPYEFEYYFYENDSKDYTPHILENWIKKRKGKFLSEKLNTKKFGHVTDIERMLLLCEARNKCKNLCNNYNSDYTLLFDGDIEFDIDVFKTLVNDIENTKNIAMITPNVRQNVADRVTNFTEDSYYDAYPFFDLEGNRGLFYANCPSKIPQDNFNWLMKNKIKCNSAFGGFSLVKTKFFKKCNWSTDGECDHVNFCKEIRKFGDIYINPKAKVYVDLDLTKYNLPF